MKIVIGMVKTKGRKRFYIEKYENGFAFGLNLIPKVFGFYVWLEVLR